MREAKAGRFPAPVKIGPNSVGFVEEEVLNWMRAKAEQRTSANGGGGHADGWLPRFAISIRRLCRW